MVIVAAVDRSDRANAVVKEAEILANVFNDQVHVIHVLSRAEFVDMGSRSVESLDAISMDDVKEKAANVAAEKIENIDAQSEAVGLMGAPADTIVNYADRKKARYIIVGGRKRSPAGKAIFGSITQSVLLNARCPVVSVISDR